MGAQVLGLQRSTSLKKMAVVLSELDEDGEDHHDASKELQRGMKMKRGAAFVEDEDVESSLVRMEDSKAFEMLSADGRSWAPARKAAVLAAVISIAFGMLHKLQALIPAGGKACILM